MKKPRKRLSPQERAAAAWQRAKSILDKKFDGPDDIAEAIGGKDGLTRQAMWKWTAVPPARVPKVSELTGIPRHVLRPDLPELFPRV